MRVVALTGGIVARLWSFRVLYEELGDGEERRSSPCSMDRHPRWN